MSIGEDVAKYGPEGAAFKADPIEYTKEKAGQKLDSIKAQGQEYYNKAINSLPEGLAPETFIEKIISPVIAAFVKYIMDNYLTEENISFVTDLIDGIVKVFFQKLDDFGKQNAKIKKSIANLKASIINTIKNEASKNIDSDNGIEMKTFSTDNNGNKIETTGGRRKRYTKKRRGSKRRY